MNRGIPDSLDALRLANSKPNPVNIAGYGQKSTHLGYLSWILNPYRNPLANQMINILLLQLEENDYTQNFEQEYSISVLDCIFNVNHIITNYKLGNLKYDIVLALNIEDIPGEFLLAINIEVDEASRDEQTYRELSFQLGNTYGCVGAIVFCLGTSSLFTKDSTWGGFTRINFNVIYDDWIKLIRSTSFQMRLDFARQEEPQPPVRFMVDWLDSIALECARANLAHAFIVKNISGKRVFYTKYNYRRYDQPFAYTFPLLENELKSAFARLDKFNFNGNWAYAQHPLGAVYKFYYWGVGAVRLRAYQV